MVLQLGEMQYPIENFTLSMNTIDNNQYRQQLFIYFKNDEMIDSTNLATSILDHYNGIIKIITAKREYDFSNYVFEGVNVNVTESSFDITINFSQNVEKSQDPLM